MLFTTVFYLFNAVVKYAAQRGGCEGAGPASYISEGRSQGTIKC